MKKDLKRLKRKLKPKAKKFFNVLFGVALFFVLTGSAFAISFLFGASFIVAFSLAVYTGELKHKPWKPIVVFVGALIIRLALNQYLDPVLAPKTFWDLSVSALVFLSILVIGWRIKKS
jgi:hypothetical protein